MQRTEKDSGRPYSIEEAAAKAGFDDKTVRRAIQQGQVLAERGGQGRLTIRAGVVDRWNPRPETRALLDPGQGRAC